MSRQRCKGKTKAGKPCRSRQVGPDGYCRHHSQTDRREGATALQPAEAEGLAKPLQLGGLVRELIEVGGWQDAFALGFIQTRALDGLLSGEANCTFDDASAAIIRAGMETLLHKITEECQVTTVLEKMVVQRIVMSYLRLGLAEYAYSHCDASRSVKYWEHLRRELSAA